MKRLIVFVLLLLGVAAWANSNSSVQGKEEFKGVWEYSVPNAPYEYSTGKLVFEEVAGKLTITVKFKNGTEIKSQEVKLENDSISFGVMVDYEMVKVTGKLLGNRIVGKANSSQGIMDLTAVRPNKAN